jgi:hypothetical protein
VAFRTISLFFQEQGIRDKAAMKNCDLEGADNLPISGLCTNGGYLVEICIEREEGRSLEYRKEERR